MVVMILRARIIGAAYLDVRLGLLVKLSGSADVLISRFWPEALFPFASVHPNLRVTLGGRKALLVAKTALL